MAQDEDREALTRLTAALDRVAELEGEKKKWIDGWKARHTEATERLAEVRRDIRSGQRALAFEVDHG